MSSAKEYFKIKRVSNSLLGTIQNPKFVGLQQKGLIEDEDKVYFRIGSAIDCLMTNSSEWEKEFFLSRGNRPSGLLGKFVDKLPPGITPSSPEEMYQEAYKHAGYKVNIANVIKWFGAAEDVVIYYKDRFLDIGDKSILTKDEYEIVNNAVKLLEENKYTSYYFKGDEEHIERLLQLPIYFEGEGVECKALLDGLLINHKERTIQPFDLKTIGKGVYHFPSSFWQFGYFRQAAFYLIALQHYIKERCAGDSKDIDKYEILPFKFIVVDNKLNTYNPALIFEVNENDVKVGVEGGVVKETQQAVRGLKSLIEDYKWHVKHNKWLLPREAYESQGVLKLNAFYNEQDSKKYQLHSPQTGDSTDLTGRK